MTGVQEKTNLAREQSDEELQRFTPAEGVRALFVMNQEDGGFDCPRCAWPDDPSGLHLDICENGVKHVTWVRHCRLQHAKRSARRQAPRSPDHPRRPDRAGQAR